MTTTSQSLLARLSQPDDEDAWRRFVELYEPLLKYWLRRFPLQPADAADLLQDILTALLAALPSFERRPGARFRGWLWTLTLNKYRERSRKLAARPERSGMPEVEQACVESQVVAIEDDEYRQYLVRRSMELLRCEIEPMTWKACWEFVANSRPAVEVAAELGISVNAVYLAKSRVLRRLRVELEGLCDL